VSLAERVRLAAEFKADVFLSIHCDASENLEASGQSVFIWTETKIAEPLGRALEKALAAHFPDRKQRGLHRANFYVIRKAPCLAALVECGFVSNPEDRAWLLEIENQKKIAGALCDGLLAWHGGVK
jgi:N-acetylmuramoyl-L-alanine amidase